MKLFRTFAVAAVATLLAVPARAQASNATYMQQKGMDERFRVDLGGFFQTFDTTISLANSAGTAGTSINLEDLGQDTHQTSFAADGYWRFGRHGRLDFAYRGWNRSASHTLDKDVVVGDVTYHAGARSTPACASTIGELYYSYSFVNNGDLEFGLGLGLSTYWNAFEASGTGTVSGGGQSGSASFQAESRNLVAPIPALKAYFSYALYPRLFARAAYKGITGTVDGYHGEMQDFRGGLDYFFNETHRRRRVVPVHEDVVLARGGVAGPGDRLQVQRPARVRQHRVLTRPAARNGTRGRSLIVARRIALVALAAALSFAPPASAFDSKGHVVLEALAYRTLVEGHDGQPPRPEVLRDLINDGALDLPFCFGRGDAPPEGLRRRAPRRTRSSTGRSR